LAKIYPVRELVSRTSSVTDAATTRLLVNHWKKGDLVSTLIYPDILQLIGKILSGFFMISGVVLNDVSSIQI
jgi:hypothetical protein